MSETKFDKRESEILYQLIYDELNKKDIHLDGDRVEVLLKIRDKIGNLTE